MSCSTSSTIVPPTSSTFSPGDRFRDDSAGSMCTIVSSDEWSPSSSALSPNSTLCENKVRIPPRRSFSGRTSALNLIRKSPRMFGRTSTLRGLLDVRVAKLEDDLRVADREPFRVGDPSAQDERVVIEPEVRRIQEQHFADLQRLRPRTRR